MDLDPVLQKLGRYMENIYMKKIVPVIVIVLVGTYPTMQLLVGEYGNIVVIWDADSLLVPQSTVYSIQKWLVVGTQYRYRYWSALLWSRSILARLRLQLVKLSPPP